MYTDYNILDPKIIENILKFSDINKDLTYTELINILDNNPNRYSMIYTSSNRILHITDNEGLIYFNINVDIYNKKIYLLFKDNKDRTQTITFNLNYDESSNQIENDIIKRYNKKYDTIIDATRYIRYIQKSQILEYNKELYDYINETIPNEEFITNTQLQSLFWKYYTE